MGFSDSSGTRLAVFGWLELTKSSEVHARGAHPRLTLSAEQIRAFLAEMVLSRVGGVVWVLLRPCPQCGVIVSVDAFEVNKALWGRLTGDPRKPRWRAGFLVACPCGFAALVARPTAQAAHPSLAGAWPRYYHSSCDSTD